MPEQDDYNDAGRCQCGYKATVHEDMGYFWVKCNKADCWISPVNRRRDKVIALWKIVMQRNSE